MASSLPPPTLENARGFVGRSDELGWIDDHLRGKGRLLTLTGPPGVGTSRLAAESTSGRNTIWCPLATARGESGLVLAVARALGVVCAGPEPPADTVAAALSARAGAVLVLDPFEHLLDCAGVVQGWLDASGVSVVAVSRSPLGLPAEEVLEVGPLTPGDARRLLRARAPTGHGPLLDDEADDLLALLDRLPLGIELAASRLGLFGPRQLAEQLAAGTSLGGATTSGLESAIAWSWNLLPPDERAALGALTVFSGGFFAEAGAAVIGDEGRPGITRLSSLRRQSLVASLSVEGRVRLALYDSIRRFVIAQAPPGTHLTLGERRVDLDDGTLLGPDGPVGTLTGLELEVVRYLASHRGQTVSRRALLTDVWGYAPSVDSCAPDTLIRVLRRKLEPATSAPRWIVTERGTGYRLEGAARGAGARDRHAGWYARLGEPQELEALDGADGPARRRRLALEEHNLEAALVHARDVGDAPQIGALTLALVGARDGTAPPRPSAEAADRALDLEALAPRERIRLLLAAATMWREASARPRAIERSQQAVDAARAAGDRHLLGRALLTRGVIEGGTEAEGWLTEALDLHRRVGDRRYEGRALAALAVGRMEGEDYPGALQLFPEAQAILREVHDVRHEAKLLCNQATTYFCVGRSREAARLLQAAVELHEEAQDAASLCTTLLSQGWLLVLDRGAAAGGPILERAIGLARAAGQGRRASTGLWLLGFAALCADEPVRASALFQEAEVACPTTEQVWAVARTRAACLRALLAAREGDFDTARERARTGLAIAQEFGHRRNLALALARTAESAAVCGDGAHARERMGRALEFEDVGPYEAAEIAVRRVRVRRRLGDDVPRIAADARAQLDRLEFGPESCFRLLLESAATA